MAKKKFTELMERQAELLEAEENKPRRIRFREAMTADIVNGNGRRYSAPVLEAAVLELQTHLNESAGQGRIVQVLGEAEHPSDKPTGRPNLLETVVKWDEVSFDGKHIAITGRVLETSKGQDFLKLMEGGVLPGVSMRGYGEGKNSKTPEGDKVFEVTELHITGFDPVLNPSFKNSAEWVESQNQMDDGDEPSGENEMSEELAKQLKESADEKAALQTQLQEAQAKVAEAEKVKAELEESKRAAEVAKAVEEVIQSLPFGEKLNKMFTESIKGASFGSAQDVKTFAEAKRKEYGKLAAEGALVGMGWDEKKQSIVVIGDVLETETGTPEFGRAAFEIMESYNRRNNKQFKDLRKNSSPAAVYALQILERFDQSNQAALMRESRMLSEAETASDLNLLASVNRAVIAEAVPELTVANIFDFGLMNSNPENIYYEAFAGESGYTNTVTNEGVTSSEGAWVSMAYKRIVPTSVVVTDHAGTTTYTEGTDYVIDHELGRLFTVTAANGGTIGNGTDLHVDYVYNALRNGEGNEIQQGEVGLSYQTITAAADRLADYITDEAIKFSRSQLGWDAVTRTMSSLIYQMRLNIEKGVVEKAMGGALSVASNSGGTWTAATDPWSLLAEYIGYAKVKVINRYYATPGGGALSVICSPATADYLSNWDGFTRVGFPDATLSSAGFAGMSVKGMPVFASTQMRDKWLLVTRRDMVMHRVYSPMTVKGPFPVYGSNHKLIAGDQYYGEEYNASLCPLPGKASYVKIV